jgi:4-amino-4-deoxychorismate lyase
MCVQHWRRHLEKLHADCHALGIVCPEPAVLLSDIAQIASKAPDCVVKIIVTRGTGLRGYAPPAQRSSTRVIMASALPDMTSRDTGVNVHLCALRLGYQPALAGIKHLNRLENVIARAEWNDAEIGEGLLCDQDGNAVSGTMSNLFVVEGATLLTPDLTRCGVAGITRQRVLDIAQCHAVPTSIEHISLQRVYNATEVFLVNSVIGVWPIMRLVHQTWVPGAVTEKVKQWLEEDDAAAV